VRVRKLYSGFTLVELVAVIVIISILAVIGSGFMLQTADSYHQSVSRSQLIQSGRQAVERITRQLRIAAPNSVRVSGNNQCIEWLPVVAGGNYLETLPDQENGAPATSTIDTAPMSLGLGSAEYVAVGGLASGEFYSAAPGSLELFSALDTSAVPNVVTLGNTKRFIRNSVNFRLFILDHPQQFCVSGGQLTFHENYTGAGNYPDSTALSGSPPNAGVLLAEGVNLAGEVPFALDSSTEARNTIVNMELPFEKNNERVVLRHQVMVRNVP